LSHIFNTDLKRKATPFVHDHEIVPQLKRPRIPRSWIETDEELVGFYDSK